MTAMAALRASDGDNTKDDKYWCNERTERRIEAPVIDSTDRNASVDVCEGETVSGTNAGGPHLELSDSFVCPLCLKCLKSSATLWQHINIHHISCGEFPSVTFLCSHARLVCSHPSCHWTYHKRFACAGCRCSLGERNKRCGGTLVDPREVAGITSQASSSTQSPPSPAALLSTMTSPPMQPSPTLTPTPSPTD